MNSVKGETGSVFQRRKGKCPDAFTEFSPFKVASKQSHVVKESIHSKCPKRKQSTVDSFQLQGISYEIPC
jgi:hypothetical protein